VLHDRLVGVLCLGAATLAATWGGNDALHHAPARAAKGALSGVHIDAAGPAAGGADSGPVATDSSSTTAPPVSSTTAGAAPGATTTTARPGEAPAVLAALAKRALLAPTDVPAGFVVTSPAPPDGAAPADSPIERCVGPDAGKLTAAIGARARSATFAKPDTGSVSSSAVVFDQPASAEKVLALMTTPAARSCFEGLINARLARNRKLSQDVRGSLGPAATPAVGEGAMAYRFEVRLPAEDVEANAGPDDPPVRFVADFLFVRKGRTLVLAEFDNLRQPWVDTALRGVAAALAAHA
jgi:hypothetical protein